MVKQVVVPSIVTASTFFLCGVIIVGVLLAADPVNAFVPVRISSHHPTQAVGGGIAFVRLDAAAAETTSINHAVATAGASSGEPKKKTLGLLTFDLDDTLYPIAPVIDEANAAFARAMARFGYEGLTPMDIVETGKLIREEIAAQNPKSAVVLTHTEIRELSIRREMENIMLAKKLKETADDWATPVSDLASIVVANAKKWARTAVSPSIVKAVLTAWEMERHHAAERHLYPEVMDVLAQIKEEHPDVIIGAVTDGRANPMFMTFTLAPYFDFCMSWEDDQGARSKFFMELSSVEGNAELSWIYNAAFERYEELRSARDAINAEAPQQQQDKHADDERLWIHVGDDLAYDVGGSALCGAKTILVELADKYQQTARHRFDGKNPQPSWSTSPLEELEKRRLMNEAALPLVDQTIAFYGQLPEAINNILEKS